MDDATKRKLEAFSDHVGDAVGKALGPTLAQMSAQLNQLIQIETQRLQVAQQLAQYRQQQHQTAMPMQGMPQQFVVVERANEQGGSDLETTTLPQLLADMCDLLEDVAENTGRRRGGKRTKRSRS